MNYKNGSDDLNMEGLVFNIQRFSVHDGGGIRTIIFLKGCPLACPWCSNPESRLSVSPTTWIKNGKEEIVGEWQSVENLIDEVMKDEIFYRTSGGGVTLSGGEVLMQSAFAAAILKELNELGIHTAIETTGCFSVDRIQTLAPYLNQVLFDFKIMNSRKSKKIIGVNMSIVKENFDYLLSQKQIELIPRIPLIPNYTDSLENINEIIDYLNKKNVREVHLLPFHQYGSNKYEYLGWNYQMKDVETLTVEEINKIKSIFEKHKINANVDGLE